MIDINLLRAQYDPHRMLKCCDFDATIRVAYDIERNKHNPHAVYQIYEGILVNGRRDVQIAAMAMIEEAMDYPGINLFRMRHYAFTPVFNMDLWVSLPALRVLPKLNTEIQKGAYKADVHEALDDIIIPEHELIEKIGEGSQSVVYRAGDSAGRTVAVKIFKQFDEDMLLRGNYNSARFPIDDLVTAREAFDRVIESPYFGKVLDSGRCLDPRSFEKTRYIILPYAEIGPIEEHGTLRSVNPQTVFMQLLDALHTAHEQGYVLCDVRLSNILECKDDILINDLDLAVKEAEAQYTVFNPGSRSYVDPQLRDSKEYHAARRNNNQYPTRECDGIVIERVPAAVSKTSDLYSAAVCALVLLTQDPHVIRRINDYDEAAYTPALERTLTSLLGSQRSFFRRALAYSREERYQSAREMKKAAQHIF